MELSKSWKPAKRHVRWYTGGAITVAGDSSIAALCADKVSLLDTSTGALIRTINEDSGVRVMHFRRFHTFHSILY